MDKARGRGERGRPRCCAELDIGGAGLAVVVVHSPSVKTP